MVNLYKSLEENGIDCYIVSASFIDIVRAFATDEDNDYGMDKKKVLGLRLMKDYEERILPKFDRNFPITIRKGKVETINEFIKNDSNYGPIMVGGDSDGDFEMLTGFDETEISLIINRENTGSIKSLRKKATQGSNRFYLQERNVNEGRFVSLEKS